MFPSQRYEFLCVTCKADDVAALVKRVSEAESAHKGR